MKVTFICAKGMWDSYGAKFEKAPDASVSCCCCLFFLPNIVSLTSTVVSEFPPSLSHRLVNEVRLWSWTHTNGMRLSHHLAALRKERQRLTWSRVIASPVWVLVCCFCKSRNQFVLCFCFVCSFMRPQDYSKFSHLRDNSTLSQVS